MSLLDGGDSAAGDSAGERLLGGARADRRRDAGGVGVLMACDCKTDWCQPGGDDGPLIRMA